MLKRDLNLSHFAKNLFSNRLRVSLIIGGVILLIAGGLITAIYVQNAIKTNQTASTQGQPGNSSQSGKPVAKVINSTAVNLVEKKFGYCRALAPKDWSHLTNDTATGADLFSPGKTIHAGWGISPVNTGNYPPYSFPSITSFLKYWLGYAFTGKFSGNSITLKSTHSLSYGFVERDFTTTTGRKGTIIYKTYNFGSSTYVVSIYMADTTSSLWSSKGAQALYSAISIRCVSQARPSTSSTSLSGSDPSSSSDNPEVSLSDKWTEAIMGYENVYSPTTGEHYEAPLDSYWATGPDGGGYYRSVPGGDYEKLKPGFGDY